MAKRARQEDFLKAIAGVAAEVRRKIETECPGFDTSPEASTRRKKRALGDFGFFCQTYFPHYVKGQPSSFHEFLWRRLPEIVASNRGERELIAAPRGNAKSTYVTLLFVLWCLLTKRKRFPVILADTFEQAAVHLASLKAEVEVNPRLAADWPDEVGAGPVWQATEVVLKNGGKVKVGGSGKALRGMRHGAQRPDLVICDDLENDENVKNPDQRKKLESWLDKAVEPLGPPDGSMDLIWVNTFLHYDAVALRKSRNPLWRSTIFKAIIREPDRADLWQRWEEVLRNEGEPAADAFYAANEAALLAGSEVLWPSVQPLIKLWKIKVRVGAASFSSEYQNEPIDEEGQLFGNITFWVERRREWQFFGVCDPSLGKSNKGGDPSAILVGGIDRETGILDVVEADIRRRVPDKIIEDIIRLHREYHCLRWGIEAVQFQEFFRTELVKVSARRGHPVPAVPILNSTDKVLRIEGVQPHVTNGLIRLHPSQVALIEQLRFFPQHPHDDGPDALEMLWRIAHGARGGSAIRVGGVRLTGGSYFDGYLGSMR